MQVKTDIKRIGREIREIYVANGVEFLSKEELRGYMYRELADPLCFKYLRGEIEKQVWIDEVKRIETEWGD